MVCNKEASRQSYGSFGVWLIPDVRPIIDNFLEINLKKEKKKEKEKEKGNKNKRKRPLYIESIIKSRRKFKTNTFFIDSRMKERVKDVSMLVLIHQFTMEEKLKCRNSW